MSNYLPRRIKTGGEEEEERGEEEKEEGRGRRDCWFRLSWLRSQGISLTDKFRTEILQPGHIAGSMMRGRQNTRQVEQEYQKILKEW